MGTQPEIDNLHAIDAKSGGARRDRTADLLHAMQALSQLSYGPLFVRYCILRRNLTYFRQNVTEKCKPVRTRGRREYQELQRSYRQNIRSASPHANICIFYINSRRNFGAKLARKRSTSP